MKTLGAFSQKKFQGLDPQAQIKALDKLLSSLDEALSAGKPLNELIRNIQECLTWVAEPLPDNLVKLSANLAKASSPREAELAIASFKASLGQSFKDSHLTLREQDGPRFVNPQTLERAQQVILILDNLRSAFNIGAIFRSAECLGLQAIWLCGVCATPENPALVKTARGTTDKVAWRHFSETSQAVLAAKTLGYTVYALETAPQAGSVFTARYSLPLALVLGGESLGIGEALALCDEVVALPVQGWKNSLNVAVACAVCAYQIVFGCQTAQ